MSVIIAEAVKQLSEKLSTEGFEGSAKFVIEGEGAIVVDASGVRVADDPADVTLTSDIETFHGLFEGTRSPASAFMSGRLKVDGDMGKAMKLGALLA